VLWQSCHVVERSVVARSDVVAMGRWLWSKGEVVCFAELAAGCRWERGRGQKKHYSRPCGAWGRGTEGDDLRTQLPCVEVDVLESLEAEPTPSQKEETSGGDPELLPAIEVKHALAPHT
jgi:hypothetical protein